MWRWVALFVVPACLADDLVVCGDGRLCAVGRACDEVHHSCVDPDQLTKCAGVADLVSCTTSHITNGHCFDGVCILEACGNGFVEPGERCDDGNVASGDGCSADCNSLERCGDGVADGAEQCDDGNQRSHDGCSSVCRFEDLVWRSHNGSPPNPAIGPASYDLARRHLVMVGGGPLTTTWEWSGQAWTDVGGTNAPPRRIAAAVAYDARHHQLVLFGGHPGTSPDQFFDDTWLWDGFAWQRARPTSVPPARYGQAMAWDGDSIVMFGGLGGSDDPLSNGTALDDTWRWDGAEWSQVNSSVRPSAGFAHTMAFDPDRRRIVMTGTGTAWTFDGSSWTQMATSPPALSQGAVGLNASAYDPQRHVVVVSGYLDVATQQVWELSDTTWSQVAVTGSPDLTSNLSLVFDPTRGRTVELGATATGVVALWDWDGATWTPTPSAPPVFPRQDAGMASDPLRGRVVMFGGGFGTFLLPETLEWNGERWSVVASSGPPPRFSPAMAYDGHAVLMFGGADSSGVVNDTWTWDGASWVGYSGPAPSARQAAAIAYDAARHRVVLFGGRDSTGDLDDTWEWNGTIWAAVSVGSHPPARSFAGAAYDSNRRRTVLFGGSATLGKLSDTWEWDGATWSQASVVLTPEPRSDHKLVFDRARGRTVVIGGVVLDFSTWEWDGQRWTHVSALVQPTGVRRAAAAYDDARGETVVFGGVDNFNNPHNWTVTGSYLGSPEETCGSGFDLDGDGLRGCDDPDCAFVCEPACLLGQPCSDGPQCGDHVCNGFETDRLCPADCAPATPLCGDGYCTPNEVCLGDC